MFRPLVIAALSFVIGILLLPLVRRLSVPLGLVDNPDGRRKLQKVSTPLGGGVAVFLAGLGALALGSLLLPDLAAEALQQKQGLLGLLLGAVIICVVGILDDRWGLRGRHKLAGQLCAIAAVVCSGTVIRNVALFGQEIELGLLAVPFTVFWLLGTINSLNLLDGMDGLLGSVGVIVTGALAAMALVTGHSLEAVVALALAGALAAFLCFNFPPALIYLGDAGSMLVGLVVGVVAIAGSLKGPATVTLIAPLALLVVPILDTAAAITRRTLTGRGVFATDRGHIHHCMLGKGLDARRVLLIIALLSLFAAAGAFGSVFYKNEEMAVIAAVAVAAILVVTRLFGVAELALVREHVMQVVKSFLGHRGARHHGVQLQGSVEWQPVWQAVLAYAEEHEFDAVRLDVNAPAVYEGFHGHWARSHVGPDRLGVWRVEMPLTYLGHWVGHLHVEKGRGRGVVRDDVRKAVVITKMVEEVEKAIAGHIGAGYAQPAAAEPVVIAVEPVPMDPAPAPRERRDVSL